VNDFFRKARWGEARKSFLPTRKGKQNAHHQVYQITEMMPGTVTAPRELHKRRVHPAREHRHPAGAETGSPITAPQRIREDKGQLSGAT